MKILKQHIHQNALAGFRKKWGLTQQQVAEQMQLSRSMVSMIEQGKRMLPTNILLQLAQLEMKTLTEPAGAGGKTIYPGAGIIVARCKRHCEELSARELYCREKAMQLKQKLDIMIALYQKTAQWMEVISLHLKEAGNNKNIICIWKKHELSAMRTLSSCSLPSQLLLKHTIASHNEEAELHKHKQLRIKQELSQIILHTQVPSTA